MKLPYTKDTPLIRTDFSDQAAWEAVVARIRTPSEPDEFEAHVTLVEDRSFDGWSSAELVAALPPDSEQLLLIVLDDFTFEYEDQPVLVIVLNGRRRGETFRCTPEAVQVVENNLSICNMDVDDFYAALGERAVFRGF